MSPRKTSPTTATPTPGPLAEPTADELADIAGLGYEQARDELAGIVGGLESGQVPLEESMRLWRRGEALAAHCAAWLDGAQRQVEAATGPGRAEPGAEGSTGSGADDAGSDPLGDGSDASG